MAPPRGTQRGQQGSARGRGGGGGGATQGRGPSQGGPPSIATHVETIGVRRPGFGTSGRSITVTTNHFPCVIPDGIIHHYDVVISPADKVYPLRFNMDLIAELQDKIAPKIFTPRAVYDGRKNLFAPRALPLGDTGSMEFPFPVVSEKSKPFKVRLTKVAEINPETLARFLKGQQSHDNAVLTAITALNVVIRMEPTLNKNYAINVRSFFTDKETKDIGNGLVLWRGYFQSIRPAVGRMLINVDISTGVMYKPGNLLDLCREFISHRDPNALAPRRGFPDRERVKLQRFITGVRIRTRNPDTGLVDKARPRVVKRLSSAGAGDLTFSLRDGGQMTVAQYFLKTYKRPLRFPDVLCAEVGSGALIPLEVCEVFPGQIMRKQVPPEKTKDVLEFATKRPGARLDSIKNGLDILKWSESAYVRQFGLKVDPNVQPLQLQARVLVPPTLKYGPNSKQVTIVPRDGAWNMVDKKFYRPTTIQSFAIVVFERRQRFNENDAREMGKSLLDACRQVGINVQDTNPSVFFANGQNGVVRELLGIGGQFAQMKKPTPPLLVVVLPDGASDIYTAVKYFGDVHTGVATQCLKSHKCKQAKSQYFANVCLKINVKLGGINTIPDPRSVAFLTDPQNPTMVMGCDTIHPAPGSDGRPSFASVVANVDSDGGKYIATSSVQESRVEMVEDLKRMTKYMVTKFIDYRTNFEKKQTNQSPKRIIFYRDGVSEGQFKQVLEKELPLIRDACKEIGITPKITIIIVGKRHHVRFFPSPRDADRSGNCPAGTVVDRDVVHPTEFDFYLQSHGGLLGTSRPAHYSILYDENGFSADGLQSLSFALCHVYARATRSVSIPAPVYYADIVCSRAKNHYDPEGTLNFSEESTIVGDAQTTLDNFKSRFQPLHARQAVRMYFS